MNVVLWTEHVLCQRRLMEGFNGIALTLRRIWSLSVNGDISGFKTFFAMVF